MLIEIKRIASDNDGTRGVLFTPGLALCTIELPWRDNENDFSCIPAGLYHCEFNLSPTRGKCYRLFDVPDRGDILIHPLNYAGDRRLAKKSESKGCIGVGLHHDVMRGQWAVLQSRRAMDRLLEFVGEKSFNLCIENLYSAKEAEIC